MRSLSLAERSLEAHHAAIGRRTERSRKRGEGSMSTPEPEGQLTAPPAEPAPPQAHHGRIMLIVGVVLLSVVVIAVLSRGEAPAPAADNMPTSVPIGERPHYVH